MKRFRSTLFADALTSKHVSEHRFLVRLRLDLFLSGRHADRTTGAGGGRTGALPPVPAGADLQGAGLDHLAVQSLSGQGPPHVARPRAAMRGPLPPLPAA